MKRLLLIAASSLAVLTARGETELNLRTARFGAAAATVGSKVYVCAGWGNQGVLDSIEVIDPAAGTVEELPLKILPRRFLASAVWQDKIVLVGGLARPHSPEDSGFTDVVELVDPIAGVVINLPPLPHPRSYCGAAVVGDRLYVVGGERAAGRRTGAVDIFDFTTRTWNEGPDLRVPRECSVAVVGSRLYALGGYDGRATLDIVECLDTASSNRAWTARPPLAAPQSAHRAVSDGDQVYLFGDYRTLVQVAAGNPETGAWRLLDLPYLRSRHTAAAWVGDQALVAGGNITGSGPYLKQIQIFPRSVLQAAPARATPPPEAKPESPGATSTAQQIDLAARRLLSWSNLVLRGTWDLSYTADGVTWTTRAPYELILQRPSRLYVRLGHHRAWFHEQGFTVADEQTGLYFQAATNSTLEDLLVRQAYPLVELLPLGHRALISAGQAAALRQHMRHQQVTVEADGLWQGHPTWTLAYHASHRPDQVSAPGYRLHLDPDSGVAVEWVSRRDPANADPGAPCLTRPEEILHSLAYHFRLEAVETNASFRGDEFVPALDPAWTQTPFAQSVLLAPGRPASLPAVLQVLRQQDGLRMHAARNLPPPLVPLWETRLCGDEVSLGYDRYALSRITPSHAVIVSFTNLVVLQTSDGQEVLRQALPEAVDPQHPRRQSAAWVQGARPEDDRLVLMTQDNRAETGGPTRRLRAFNRAGDLTGDWRDEELGDGIWIVLPGGGTRAEMLVLAQGSGLQVVQTQPLELGPRITLRNERVEFTDRDHDRWPEFTFIGSDLACYEWSPAAP